LHRLLAPKWRSIVNSASAVVSPSDGLSQLIKDRGARTEVLTIPNGLDIGQYHAHRQRSKQILVVAKMLQRKGIQYLVRALADSDLGYEVHIVGDGPYLPELKKLAEETGADVRFWGWLDNNSPELEELFENSRIFVLPSEAENFPIVLLEAMRAGLAIVTTRGTGCAEVVGDAAILVEPCSPEAIRAALDRLVADDGLRQSLGAAGRTRIESNFSWAAVATRYVRLYEQCRHRGAVGKSESDSDDALPSTRSP
jgi:glycosyltransferase involved in cell wall biosynthesis